MKQNKIIWLFAGVLIVFSFAGCQPTTSSVPTQQLLPTTQANPASATSVNSTQESYPAVETGVVPTQESYPAAGTGVVPTQESYPAAGTGVVPTQETYPSPVSGPTAVAWADALQIIQKGDVTQIVQTKSLDVTLTLKDGSTDTTTAPSADAVQKAIATCGDLCSNISVTIQ